MIEYGSAQTDDGFTVLGSNRTSEQITQELNEPKKEAPKAQEPPPEPEETQETPSEPKVEAKEPEKTEEERKLGKPRHDPKARMLEATRQAAEAKRERDEIARRAEEYRLELEKLKSSATESAQAQQIQDDKPKADDPKFKTYEDYVEALTDWKVNQREKQAAEQNAQKMFEESKRKIYTGFEAVMKAETESNPGWIDKIDPDLLELKPSAELPPGVKPGRENMLADLLIFSPVAPKLLMHFTEHPEDLQRFSTLHPLRFGVEFGKLEDRMTAATTATAAPEVSKAKPPVRPVTGGPTTVDKVPGDDASFEEHAAYWDSVERKKRSTR